jgi:RecA-family ATPase
MRTEPENDAAAQAAADAALVAHMLGDAEHGPQNATAPTPTNVEAEDLRKRVALAEQTQAKMYANPAEKASAKDPLAIPEAEYKAFDHLKREVKRLTGLDWTLVIVKPYDPYLAARGAAPDADAETKRKAKSNGKAPFGGGWQKRASSDFDAVMAWAREALERFGRCPNLGALAGAYIRPRDGQPGGYLLPVDLDVKGPTGEIVTTLEARRAEIEAKIGVKLPPTVSDTSAGGGGHDWLLSPAPLTITQKVALMPGVDIPHQTVIAPSTRAGRTYAWNDGCAPGERPLEIAPTELVAFVQREGARREKTFDKDTGKARVADGAEADGERYKKLYRHWLDNHAPEAVFNDGRHKAAVAVLQYGRDLCLSVETSAELAFESKWNNERCHPTPYDLDRLIQIAETSEPSRKNKIGYKCVEAVFDVIADGTEPPSEELKEKVNRWHRQKAADEAGVLLTIPASYYAGKPVPERKWLVPDLIVDHNVTMINGDGGVGKSLLALQLAVSAAAGATWLGLSVKHGPALFFSAEDEEEELHIRLAEITRAEGVALDTLSGLKIIPMSGLDAMLALPDEKGVLKPTNVWHRLRRTVLAENTGVAVLDTLADVYGGDENVRVQARAFITLCRGLAVDAKCSLILLAHPSLNGLNSGSGTSGSTGWNNSVRSRLYLTRPDEKDPLSRDDKIRILTTKKQNRSGGIGDERVLRWENHRFIPAKRQILAGADVEGLFLRLLVDFTHKQRWLSPNKGARDYAPTIMAKTKEAREAGVNSDMLEDAMDALPARSIVKDWEAKGNRHKKEVLRATPDAEKSLNVLL